MTYREKIVGLCVKAGMCSIRIEEIMRGAVASRAYKIIRGQQYPFQPGVLTLSDHDAALDAELIALDCILNKRWLDDIVVTE